METLRRSPIAFAFDAPCRMSNITVADDASTGIASNGWLSLAQGSCVQSLDRIVE